MEIPVKGKQFVYFKLWTSSKLRGRKKIHQMASLRRNSTVTCTKNQKKNKVTEEKKALNHYLVYLSHILNWPLSSAELHYISHWLVALVLVESKCLRRERLFNFQDREFLQMNLLNICKAKEKYFTAAVMEKLWLRIYKPCVKLFQTVLNH